MNIVHWMQFVALAICLVIVVAKDYYEILGVKRDATEKQIKKRFRQLGTVALSFRGRCDRSPRSAQVSSRQESRSESGGNLSHHCRSLRCIGRCEKTAQLR